MTIIAITPAVIFLASLSLLVSTVEGGEGSNWGYKGSTGPGNWVGMCSAGRKQSPINIDLVGNQLRREVPFRFKNYDKVPAKSYVTNARTTVKLSLQGVKEKKLPQVSGGGLPGQFGFAQLHFHWGSTDRLGSEHTISGESYPMELHLVHFNTKYGEDIKEAIGGGKGKQDTLAVLGIMFRISGEEDNQDMEPIIKTLEEVSGSHDGGKTYTAKFPLGDLLPSNTDNFYRYEGSLTTPGCDEIVVWTVFKNPIDISKSQMSRFRSLSDDNPDMENNYRPAQPLNGRKVFEIDTSSDSSAPVASVSFSTMLSLLVLVAGRAISR